MGEDVSEYPHKSGIIGDRDTDAILRRKDEHKSRLSYDLFEVKLFALRHSFHGFTIRYMMESRFCLEQV